MELSLIPIRVFPKYPEESNIEDFIELIESEDKRKLAIEKIKELEFQALQKLNPINSKLNVNFLRENPHIYSNDSFERILPYFETPTEYHIDYLKVNTIFPSLELLCNWLESNLPERSEDDLIEFIMQGSKRQTMIKLQNGKRDTIIYDAASSHDICTVNLHNVIKVSRIEKSFFDKNIKIEIISLAKVFETELETCIFILDTEVTDIRFLDNEELKIESCKASQIKLDSIFSIKFNKILPIDRSILEQKGVELKKLMSLPKEIIEKYQEILQKENHVLKFSSKNEFCRSLILLRTFNKNFQETKNNEDQEKFPSLLVRCDLNLSLPLNIQHTIANSLFTYSLNNKLRDNNITPRKIIPIINNFDTELFPMPDDKILLFQINISDFLEVIQRWSTDKVDFYALPNILCLAKGSELCTFEIVFSEGYKLEYTFSR
jgi:hypothetical protein